MVISCSMGIHAKKVAPDFGVDGQDWPSIIYGFSQNIIWSKFGWFPFGLPLEPPNRRTEAILGGGSES